MLPGRRLNITADVSINQGLTSLSAGTLSLNSTTWSNPGQFSVSGGTLNLGGGFNQLALGVGTGSGTFTRTGGTLNVTGTLTGNLVLNDTVGNLAASWAARCPMGPSRWLRAVAPKLIATTTQSTLSGVTLATPIDLVTNSGANLKITNDLTLAPGLVLPVGNAAGTTSAFVSLQGGD